MVAQYHKIRGNEASIINDIARCAPCHQPDKVNNNVLGVDSQFGHVNIRLSSPVPSGSMRYERRTAYKRDVLSIPGTYAYPTPKEAGSDSGESPLSRHNN